MAWNDPDKKNNSWNGGSNPPELDDLINDLKSKVGGMFGGNNKGSGGDGDEGNQTRNKNIGGFLGFATVLALVAWLAFGFYIVDPAERGVELRFGEFQRVTSEGLNWHLPYPIETVNIVNVDQVRTAAIGFRSSGNTSAGSNVSSESLMLTKDENIIDIKFAVQYKIADAKDYLFRITNPDNTLRQAAESVIREVVGKNEMDFITNNRSTVSTLIEEKLQDLLNNYSIGLQLTSVNMQDAQPPEQVQAAYNDAVKAREDEQRLINEAEAYSNDVIPKARGLSARIFEEAAAYRAQVIAKAEGEATRFGKIRVEYEKAPEVTHQRLYLESMEEVFSNTTKVVMDPSGNSLMYLPLDKLLSNQSSAVPVQTPATADINLNKEQRNLRDLLRTRETR